MRTAIANEYYNVRVVSLPFPRAMLFDSHARPKEACRHTGRGKHTVDSPGHPSGFDLSLHELPMKHTLRGARERGEGRVLICCLPNSRNLIVDHASFSETEHSSYS